MQSLDLAIKMFVNHHGGVKMTSYTHDMTLY